MPDYDQRDQSIKNQFNIGRDLIIHNLVVVGQFLDFAKIEGFSPARLQGDGGVPEGHPQQRGSVGS